MKLPRNWLLASEYEGCRSCSDTPCIRSNTSGEVICYPCLVKLVLAFAPFVGVRLTVKEVRGAKEEHEVGP